MKKNDSNAKLFLDVETTGTQRDKDQVVQLAMILEKGEGRLSYKWLMKPTIEISPGALAVHKITAAMLENEKPFSHFAEFIYQQVLAADVIVGYNVDFDIAIVAAELKRCGLADPFVGKTKIDPYKLWLARRPRKLEDAYREFVGSEMTDQHDALSDVTATEAVLYEMIREFGLEDLSTDELCDACFPDMKHWCGPSEHFVWEPWGLSFGFGKSNGRPLLGYHDIRYMNWMLGGTFPQHVKDIVSARLHWKGDRDGFHAAMEEVYGGTRQA